MKFQIFALTLKISAISDVHSTQSCQCWYKTGTFCAETVTASPCCN